MGLVFIKEAGRKEAQSRQGMHFLSLFHLVVALKNSCKNSDKSNDNSSQLNSWLSLVEVDTKKCDCVALRTASLEYIRVSVCVVLILFFFFTPISFICSANEGKKEEREGKGKGGPD